MYRSLTMCSPAYFNIASMFCDPKWNPLNHPVWMAIYGCGKSYLLKAKLVHLSVADNDSFLTWFQWPSFHSMLLQCLYFSKTRYTSSTFLNDLEIYQLFCKLAREFNNWWWINWYLCAYTSQHQIPKISWIAFEFLTK